MPTPPFNLEKLPCTTITIKLMFGAQASPGSSFCITSCSSVSRSGSGEKNLDLVGKTVYHYICKPSTLVRLEKDHTKSWEGVGLLFGDVLHMRHGRTLPWAASLKLVVWAFFFFCSCVAVVRWLPLVIIFLLCFLVLPFIFILPVLLDVCFVFVGIVFIMACQKICWLCLTLFVTCC